MPKYLRTTDLSCHTSESYKYLFTGYKDFIIIQLIYQNDFKYKSSYHPSLLKIKNLQKKSETKQILTVNTVVNHHAYVRTG